MSALAIKAMRAKPLDDPRDARPAAPGFHGELQRATTKSEPPRPTPPRDVHQGPRAGAGHRPRQAPVQANAGDAPATTPPPSLQVAQGVAQADQPAGDVVAMISAGKSLATAVAQPAAQLELDPALADAPPVQAAQVSAGGEEPLPTTPLEQAVHDLIDRLRDGSDKAPAHDAPTEPALPGTMMAAAAIDDAPGKPVPAPAAVREPTPAEQQVSTSHVHLVIDDGERLVLTVAVRGSEVIAHVRGDNEATAAALARNAGVLDESLRARGLNLAELQTGRDHAEPERRPHHQQNEPRERPQPRFRLEENR